MADDTEIANRALTLLGARRITSLDDESEEAQTLSALWGTTRDAAISEHPWRFALKRATLSVDGDAPEFEYARAFTLPDDCLTPWELYDLVTTDPGIIAAFGAGATLQATKPVAMIEYGAILTDLSAPLKLRYIAQIEDTTRWHASFVVYFAARLADDACETLNASNTKQQLAQRTAMTAVKTARRTNAIMTYQGPSSPSSLNLARLVA